MTWCITHVSRNVQNETSEQGSDDIFGSIYADPAAMRGFLGSMTGISKPIARTLVATFPWQNYQTILDVGISKEVGSEMEAETAQVPEEETV